MSKSTPRTEVNKYAQQIMDHYAKKLSDGAVYFHAATGQRLTDLADIIYALADDQLRTEPPNRGDGKL